MRYKTIYLPVANRDIIRIDDALAEYPNKAKRIFLEMESKVADIEEMPLMWPAYQAKPEYRRMILEDHILFYKVDEDELEVKIYRILYDKMDILEHLE